MTKLYIKRKLGNTLEVSKSKNKAALELLFFLGFFILWYSALIPDDHPGVSWLTALVNEVKENWPLIIFVFAPVLVIGKIIENYNIITKGATYSFHKLNGISFNGKPIATISELKGVQVREYTDSDDDTFYRLSMSLSKGKKSLGSGDNREKILDVAEAIADHMNVEVVYR